MTTTTTYHIELRDMNSTVIGLGVHELIRTVDLPTAQAVHDYLDQPMSPADIGVEKIVVGPGDSRMDARDWLHLHTDSVGEYRDAA